jgi:hypothetical protein
LRQKPFGFDWHPLLGGRLKLLRFFGPIGDGPVFYVAYGSFNGYESIMEKQVDRKNGEAYNMHTTMLAVTKSKKKSAAKPEFPGITDDAAALGVSRYFLWKVLKGYATSAPLMARYRQLKGGGK